MAKRRRALDSPLGSLVRQLERLDSKRRVVVDNIRQATEQMLGGLGPVPRGRGGAARVTGARRRKGGRPKGYKVSATTRAKLRTAWKRRKTAAGQKP
jgi:hypothetical protein